MIETFSNGEKITNHDWELIEYMVAKKSLGLSLAEAIELREFDKFHIPLHAYEINTQAWKIVNPQN